jgi:hypothetical protein
MAANTVPIFTNPSNISWANISTAQTDLTGVAATSVFTAGANGSYVLQLLVKSTTTTATDVGASFRVFIANSSGFGTASNSSLIMEYTLTSVTATNGGATLNFQFPVNIQLPAGYQIGVEIAVIDASTAWQVTCIGADY